MMKQLIDRAETGRLPAQAVRLGIRARIARRVAVLNEGTIEEFSQRQRALIAERADGPITTHTAEANEQHYEVRTEYFRAVLGPRLKYSSAYWPDGVESLADAEEAMLALTCERAQLADGQRILELGCGWGSLTLWMAERYPCAEIVAVSNSATQRDHIVAEAQQRYLNNVTVHTADVADFEPDGRFDRVVSVEMFEHVNNHRALMERICPQIDTAPLLRIEQRLAAGVPLEVEHVDASLRMLMAVENNLIKHSVEEVKEAVMIEQILIEMAEMIEMNEMRKAHSPINAALAKPTSVMKC